MPASGYGLMLEEPFLTGFQPSREVIYTDRERERERLLDFYLTQHIRGNTLQFF